MNNGYLIIEELEALRSSCRTVKSYSLRNKLSAMTEQMLASVKRTEALSAASILLDRQIVRVCPVLSACLREGKYTQAEKLAANLSLIMEAREQIYTGRAHQRTEAIAKAELRMCAVESAIECFDESGDITEKARQLTAQAEAEKALLEDCEKSLQGFIREHPRAAELALRSHNDDITLTPDVMIILEKTEQLKKMKKALDRKRYELDELIYHLRLFSDADMHQSGDVV